MPPIVRFNYYFAENAIRIMYNSTSDTHVNARSNYANLILVS